MPREILQDIIGSFSSEKLITLFRRKSTSFRQAREEYTDVSREQFRDVTKLGEIKFTDEMKSNLIIVTARVMKPLSERSGRKAQYDLGKKVLSTGYFDAGIFVFYDAQGSFRFSLIYPQYIGKKKSWSNFRRFTYFVSPDLANKTFIKQIGDGDFSTLDKVKESFSLAKVTNDFYNEFKGHFEKLCGSVKAGHSKPSEDEVRDFALLFVIRVIFLGFIQKRGWIGDNEKFLSDFLNEYSKKGFGREKFYDQWLEPLFFEALNSPPGTKVAYRANEFPEHIEKILLMAPYLNGGLFERRDMDEKGWFITDNAVKEFFDFLFAYNFTIEENTLYDEELELNPEFLGIIFERLVNKENGAIYTPRTEVDFMCRMALVKWLDKNNTTKIELKDLYELIFLEGGPEATESQQRRGDFTTEQKKELIDLLSGVTVCDPAVGSGAFLVGMMHVLDDVEQELRSRIRDQDYKLDIFQRKQRIVSLSLYGVEVKGWAVWITQLRLWITLFIDAPDSMRASFQPILPSLDFKIRQGDSLVQRIGNKMFPVSGHADIPSAVKAKVTRLKDLKVEFFQNKHKDGWEIRQTEYRVFRDILDAQIEEKKKKLRDLGEKPEEQFDFLGGVQEKRQEQLALYKDRIDALRAEIEELQEEKLALREERPLVWNIEFAEIFFDKGGFDIVIGNPPYVRQEAIADPLGKIKIAKEYKDALAEMVQGDFPREFRKEKLNAQSDLYTYFYIRSLRLLNEKGVHVFICSNSWLDVGYGAWLQKFLLNYAPVHFIFDNHAKRSFAAADVNTIISVIGAPVKKVTKDHMVKFVAFKFPFEEVVFTENLLEIERARAVVANEKFRVYPITDEDLFKSGLEADEDAPGIAAAGKYAGEKWGGKFLRAPDIFFTILEKGKGKLVRLGDIADVKFGIKTGADSFFYLTREQALFLKIEKEYLTPLLVSSDQAKTFETATSDTDIFLVSTDKPKSKIVGTNLYAYIVRGEKEKFHGRGGASIPAERPTCKGHRPFWYSVSIPVAPSIYWMEMRRERYFTLFNQGRLVADHTFYGVYPYDGVDGCTLCALLNSTLIPLFVEVFANDPGGGGTTLQTPTGETKRHVYLPLSLVGSKELADSFRELSKRASKSILDECGFSRDEEVRDHEPRPLPDRKKLDDIIFDAIGLTQPERKEVYWSVCELVKNRLDKAGSV